ncbi:type I DNA topoisomerase [Dehalogenimonas sp. THU2]|uniref:type I DNA topoisomerase n=1 Tax=Dehalogenimonas sp. THU2 TaxID=3151121 RepID=UPI003218309A
MVTTKKLVIVESPAKAKTLARFLGSGYTLKASLGHVRDLPKSKLGVDVEHDFTPQYVNMRTKAAVLKELRDAVKNASTVFLATDPDREGEAIAWHLIEAAKAKDVPYRRVVFHEITKEAITQAFKSPRNLDMNLVNAQQARRILDRLVGYKLSPLLWQKVRRGLSAGRVQSVALRIIVDREREICAFTPVEYWSIEAELKKKPVSPGCFKVQLIGAGEKKKIAISNAASAADLVADLKPAEYAVAKVTSKSSPRQPAPPFITSTLQQEAWRKLRFSAKQTMAIAQQLYEGLGVGQEGNVGLITYMRTDSTHVAQSAILETRDYISERYGADYLPKAPRVFASQVKGAQEAHEAIRPTSTRREPAAIKQYLDSNQFKLYQLIWQRMVASQMAAAVFDNMTVDIEARKTLSKTKYTLRAQSSVSAFPGFMTLYTEGRDDDDEQKTPKLPPLAEGESLTLLGLVEEEHFTQPPPRFTEATLIKMLEQYGIGRPSTYAPILSVVQAREYVEKLKGVFKPTELGMTVSDLLVQQFPDIIDTGFTAQMENRLDKVADEGLDWVKVVRDFYVPFEKDLASAEEQLDKVPLPVELSEEICPQCGQEKLIIKVGRYGKYMECPACSFRQSFRIHTGVQCPGCPENAEIIGRFSKKGKLFYGCAAFPKHKFAVNARPLPEPCPKCGGLVTEYRDAQKKCVDPKCDYKAKLDHGDGAAA